MFTVNGDERFNGLAQLRRAFGAQTAQGLAGQNAEPDFHLIQPTGRGGGEVKMDVGMLGQPRVALLVRAVIVQDHVQFLLAQGLLHNLVHELQKLLPPFALGECRFDFSGRDPQGSKQIERPMALISALVSAMGRSICLLPRSEEHTSELQSH